MSDKHLKSHREPDELPKHIVHTRKELSKLKEDDFRDGYEAYRKLIRTYKAAMIEFSSVSKANLRFALNMTVDDVCGVPRLRIPLAAASREVGLALGLKAVSHHPKMVLRRLREIKSGSTKATRYLADKTTGNNSSKQIKKVLEIADGTLKLAAKLEKKGATKPLGSRLRSLLGTHIL